jgi:hypothetical protein
MTEATGWEVRHNQVHAETEEIRQSIAQHGRVLLPGPPLSSLLSLDAPALPPLILPWPSVDMPFPSNDVLQQLDGGVAANIAPPPNPF